MKRERGLTLVEILVVVGVLGILMGILGIVLVPGMMKSRTKPTCAGNLRQIAVAYNLYLGDHDNGWPVAGGMVSNDRIWGLYKPPRACPLYPLPKGHYHDSYTNDRWAGGRAPAFRKAFPDGTLAPPHDWNVEVLVRCLDHGIGGFSKGSELMWVQDATHTKGKVLGVRLDGAVAYVPPISCWEGRTMTYDSEFYLFRGCDMPASAR